MHPSQPARARPPHCVEVSLSDSSGRPCILSRDPEEGVVQKIPAAIRRVLRVVVADLMPRTFYVRLLVEAEPATVSSCKHACATSFELVREAGVVVEVSCLSCEWAAKVKAEVCAWHMSALPAA